MLLAFVTGILKALKYAVVDDVINFVCAYKERILMVYTASSSMPVLLFDKPFLYVINDVELLSHTFFISWCFFASDIKWNFYWLF